MTRKPFSPERLAHIRRLRKARRLFKTQPLFAFLLMKADYPGYTHTEFLDDLRRRSKKKHKAKKSPLCRYGRYLRIDKLMTRYRETGEDVLILQAMRLRANITRPYRVLVRLAGQYTEYFFSPLISIERIEKLNENFCACKTWEEVERVREEFESKGIIN